MSNGTANAGQCYGSTPEAAAMLCSSLHGISAGGATSCVGVAYVGTSSATFNIRTLTSTGPVDAPLSVELMPCETYGLDYWSPAIGAWVVAAISIVAARMAYERIFGTPIEA